ncbi:hypothetical protein OPV22_020979 [Ensete ventricosum]|uniref:Uncharacterized protein n=1 Tax=Ensete ventricosum TaxID=4639 RepID=A0AAV8QG47_ENSVE|nr:hypothetical protein OPV22_020979 [Ensete ventricosum]
MRFKSRSSRVVSAPPFPVAAADNRRLQKPPSSRIKQYETHLIVVSDSHRVSGTSVISTANSTLIAIVIVEFIFERQG